MVGRQRRGRGGKEEKDMVIMMAMITSVPVCLLVHMGAECRRSCWQFQVIWLLQGLKQEVLDRLNEKQCDFTYLLKT